MDGAFLLDFWPTFAWTLVAIAVLAVVALPVVWINDWLVRRRRQLPVVPGPDSAPPMPHSGREGAGGSSTTCPYCGTDFDSRAAGCPCCGTSVSPAAHAEAAERGRTNRVVLSVAVGVVVLPLACLWLADTPLRVIDRDVAELLLWFGIAVGGLLALGWAVLTAAQAVEAWGWRRLDYLRPPCPEPPPTVDGLESEMPDHPELPLSPSTDQPPTTPHRHDDFP